MQKYILGIILLLIIGGTAIFVVKSSNKNTQANNSTTEQANLMKPKEIANPTPKMEIDENKKYTAVLHTSEGDITISLNVLQTPVTVNNFVSLARKGFYNKTVFHRAMKGFMIQGGDPVGNGTGGPGYRFEDEPFEGEYTRGTIAMANAGPDTNGSQFFIMHADVDLPKDYTIFGEVAEGLDAVDKIAEAPVTMSAMGELSQPVKPAVINSVDIIEE